MVEAEAVCRREWHLLMQTHYSNSGANTIVWRRGGSFEHTLAPIAVKVLACPTWKLLRVRSPTWVSTFFFSLYPCITVYGLPSLADSSEYMAALF